MESDEAGAGEGDLVEHGGPDRRWLLLGGTSLFLVLSFLVFSSNIHTGVSAAIAMTAAAALAFFVPQLGKPRPLSVLPLGTALVLSAYIVAGTVADPAPQAAHYATMFVFLGPFLSLLAPTRRTALAALIAMTVFALGGSLYVTTQAEAFETAAALGYVLTAGAVSYYLAYVLDKARHQARVLRGELARRATSDELTGVSNRAHITLLAQNEFSRARRYGEPYSCLMIEIERYDEIVAAKGADAARVIVQVFAGYCVVVMRHCDSFGRLSPNRFLALLPETRAIGALTLGHRMCHDLAGLDVAHGGAKLNFTVSIGCAEIHAVDRWSSDLLRRTEQGLADAIERGGNCAVLASVPISPRADEVAADAEVTGEKA